MGFGIAKPAKYRPPNFFYTPLHGLWFRGLAPNGFRTPESPDSNINYALWKGSLLWPKRARKKHPQDTLSASMPSLSTRLLSKHLGVSTTRSPLQQKPKSGILFVWLPKLKQETPSILNLQHTSKWDSLPRRLVQSKALNSSTQTLPPSIP